MKRSCLSAGCSALTQRTYCLVHAAAAEQVRVARRGNRYGSVHRKRAAQVIADEGWCHYPGCYATVDLTAEHLPDGEYTVLCRSHNSARGRGIAKLSVF